MKCTDERCPGEELDSRSCYGCRLQDKGLTIHGPKDGVMGMTLRETNKLNADLEREAARKGGRFDAGFGD